MPPPPAPTLPAIAPGNPAPCATPPAHGSIRPATRTATRPGHPARAGCAAALVAALLWAGTAAAVAPRPADDSATIDLPPLDDPEAETATAPATAPTASPPVTAPPRSSASEPPPDAEGWRAVTLPGKALTRYRRAEHAGRATWHAQADRSASLWRRPLACPPQALGALSFSWWVPALIGEARVDQRGRTDAPARLLLAFDGDSAGLPLATRLKFELARALSGEEPPYATLVYVWDPVLPVGSVIVSPHSDRIRKIVVESGDAGLGRWRDHRRDLAADFRLAFGEAPGALRSVALMTDGDNTGSQVQAWYGEVRLHPRETPSAASAPD